MNGKRFQPPLGRRLFMTRLGAGVGTLGATLAVAPSAAAQSAAPATGNSNFQPTLHEQDDWMDKLPGKHRFVFDTTSPEGLATAMTFANNFFEASKSGYGLTDSDQAVILVLRHKSTAFAYNDAIWAKYGTTLSTQANNFVDPNTKEAAKINVHGTPGNGTTRGGRLDGLIKRGTHMAVCQMATRAIAGQIARATGGTQDEIFKELAANLLTNAHLAPAGIVAVNRAQERGYAFVHGG